MLKVIIYLKHHIMDIPIGMGQALSYIPYELRPGVGRDFVEAKKIITHFLQFTHEQKCLYIFKQIYKLVEYSYNNISFYKRFYDNKKFSIDKLQSFDDIKRIPIVCKDDFLEYSLSDYSNTALPHYLANTGGSSGKTFSFYHSQAELGNESAFVFDMWFRQAGYKPSRLKLGFSSKGNMTKPVMYDCVRHTLCMDMYRPFSEIEPELVKALQKHSVYYLHGYPSALYEFALYCYENNSQLISLLRKSLRGVFLCSEHPFPHYRDTIESVFSTKTHAFYGHTERCIEAYELDKPFTYQVQQCYGYAETEQIAGDQYALIGTCYKNYASPLIRYNTKDIVTNPIHENNNLLKSFQIKEGREGDYIHDTNGKAIPLTGLIFGKHHPLFDYCSHIQISQQDFGFATVIYTLKSTYFDKKLEASELFDSRNVNIQFDFKEVPAPIKTKAGKVLLKVPFSSLNSLTNA